MSNPEIVTPRKKGVPLRGPRGMEVTKVSRSEGQHPNEKKKSSHKISSNLRSAFSIKERKISNQTPWIRKRGRKVPVTGRRKRRV